LGGPFFIGLCKEIILAKKYSFTKDKGAKKPRSVKQDSAPKKSLPRKRFEKNTFALLLRPLIPAPGRPVALPILQSAPLAHLPYVTYVELNN